MKRFRRVLAVVFLVGGACGLAVTLPMWLLGAITDRAMIGITLAISWLTIVQVGIDSMFGLAIDRAVNDE